MHLKKLELLGFKSFPNKTTVSFADGMTAIVGPNGCGKTNILDSLRWVLGEQKPTLLRGGKMEEIIFNGTRDLKPLGMAEVTLTIVNDRGVLPVEYTEIQVTRRLYRSGESEYLLNKVPCRLRDIIDLFVDTGMGAHSYSVIQQDMIDSVISDKAEERRFLFEEAAGITKYKHRKKAALRKLEATEHDIQRLKDIHAEVKTRVNSLYRQHKKAERYQRLSDSVRAWDLFINAERIKRITHTKRELQAQADVLADRRVRAQSALSQISSGLEADRKQLLDLERELAAINSEIYTASEQAHELEREISVLQEKRTHAAALIQKNRRDIEELTERDQALAAQFTEYEAQQAALRKEHADVTEQLTAAETELARIDQSLLTARKEREAKQQRLLELEGRLSSGIAEESSLGEQLSEISQALASTEAQLSAARQKQAHLMTELERRKETFDPIATERNTASTRQRELTTKLEELIEQSEAVSVELADASAGLEAAEARRKLLEEMMLQYEGHESGVVAAMEARERWPGIAGTVAELFVPSAGMETALEAALGDISRWLVCYDRSTAEAIIAYLRAEKRGRIGILVPQTGAIIPAVKRPLLDLPEIVGWLDSFVSTDERLKPLMQAVLARTVVFSEEASPDRILEHLPYGFAAVSTDGRFFSGFALKGGSDDRFPIFRRKEKVAEEQREIENLNLQISQLRERKNKYTSEIATLRAESLKVSSRLEELEEELEAGRARLNETEYELRSAAREATRLERERQLLSEKLERIRSRQYSLQLGHSELSQQKESMVATMGLAGDALSTLERQVTDAQSKVSRLQVAVIEAHNKVDQAEHQLQHIADLRQEIHRTLTIKTNEIEQARQNITTAAETISRLERELKTAFSLRDERSRKTEALMQRQAQLQAVANEKEQQLKTERREQDNLGEELHQIQMRMTAIESEIQAVVEKFREEYDVDILQVSAVRPDDSISDEQAAEHLHELKEKLKSFGAVNLLALEEYREASEREEFLRTQLDDLTTARKDLESTISRINQTAQHMFTETFQKVRENFQKLFVTLFTGGEASIALVDPDDPLESDIEISVRPRGKKFLSITMMSQGERALTATALLFALYLVKPSPFCILDEIDAPLDDANCRRFLNIIKEFSRQTQFIIITHNKITMEAANNLYGVTMEQPGVSKLVSVRFDNAGDNGSGAALAPEPHSDDVSPLPRPLQQRLAGDVTVVPDNES